MLGPKFVSVLNLLARAAGRAMYIMCIMCVTAIIKPGSLDMRPTGSTAVCCKLHKIARIYISYVFISSEKSSVVTEWLQNLAIGAV